MYISYVRLELDLRLIYLNIKTLHTHVYFDFSGYMSWPGNDFHAEYLYNQLVQTVGKETDIRYRQRLFIIEDVIRNIIRPSFTRFVSGSLSEGLDLPGSDIDIMYVVPLAEAVSDTQIIKDITTLLMETDASHPGFTRLRLLAGGFEDSSPISICIRDSLLESREGLYLASDLFIKNLQHRLSSFLLHGPCLSDSNQTVDFAVCFRCKSFPNNAMQWVYRHRKHWPPSVVIDNIKKHGCLLVPIGPKQITNSQFLWRISFSVAEKQLVHSFNYTQCLCYGLLKIVLKHIINKNNDVKDMLCSYFLKTAIFWFSEEVSIEIFQRANILFCFWSCFDKLVSYVKTCFCPNYFIPEHNMFQGKVHQRNNKILLKVLDGVINGGTTGLITGLFQEGVNSTCLISNRKNYSIKLDYFVYKVFCHEKIPQTIKDGYQGIFVLKSLILSESSSYIRDVCKWWISNVSQHITQQLPTPVNIRNVENIRSRYHTHLTDSLQTNSVNGWLLYASFYYAIGQYNVTIQITDHVLSKCTSEKLQLGSLFYDNDIMNTYAQNVYETITSLNKRIQLATVSSVTFLQHSSIVPDEFRLEVEDGCFYIPFVVLSYCLKFLSYHHLGNVFKRQQALRDLHLTVEERFFIPAHLESQSLTILGMCCQLNGNINTACQCFDEALQCVSISKTAEIRKAGILSQNIR